MSGRLDSHNTSVDLSVSAAGGCGTVDLRTGDVCLLPTHHPGGCAFGPAGSRPGVELEQYPVGDALVVVLGSAPDAPVGALLERRMHRAWGTFGVVVLDLSGLDVLARMDEDALVRLHRDAARHGAGLLLANGHCDAVAGLRRRLPAVPVHRTVAEALAAVPPRRSPVLTATRVLDATPAAARHARSFVRSSAEEWAVEADVVERVVDICSELVANAVKHGGGRITETLEMDVRRATVVVWDAVPQPPRMLPYRPGVSQRGLGLRIVQQLAGSWGFRSAPYGKFVWAAVARGH